MALSYISAGDKVAIGYDSATNERGFLVKLINRTGHTSVKGELVSVSPSADREVVLQSNEYDCLGVVQEAGVAEGAEMWVWMTGSVCQVLMKDTVSAVHGYLLLAADTDGRADNVTVFGAGLAAVDQHFKECGHMLQSATGGTNVLALAMIHFN